MTYRNLTIISTILAGSFGLGFLLIPQPLASLYSLNFTPDATFIARLLGAELIGYGLLAWFLRNAAPSTNRQAVLLAFFITDSLGFFLNFPAEALPFKRASVDTVFVAQALHWFDRPKFYTETARVLRPGGILGLIENNRNWRDGPFLAAYES